MATAWTAAPRRRPSRLGALASLLPLAHGSSITLLVRSQDTVRDRARLVELTAAAAEVGWKPDSVIGMADAERELGHHGLWTYKPWIAQLERRERLARRRSASGQRWCVFLEPSARVDVARLEAVLGGYDSRSPVYIGHALKDTDATIIHHYQEEPPYPLVHAGFALSGGLMRRLSRKLEEKPLGSGQQIEPVWELAQWIKQSLGVELTDRRDAFCADQSTGCATWIDASGGRGHAGPGGQRGLAPEEVVIAVKTVGKFHSTRIRHVHELWGASSPSQVLYLSNEPYGGVPGATVVDLSQEFGEMVDPGKESTKQGSGHCSKMQAILQYLGRHRPGLKWYVVTDDDTLLSVPRLLEVLDSHDHTKALYVGERYGWAHREDREGTNYVTTGGGMALSGPALRRLRECKACRCHAANAPDDMTLGSWFQELGVPVMHEEGFHQAEPHNYHPELLRRAGPAVSFHRFALTRLPGGASEEERDAARGRHWRAWAREHLGFAAPAAAAAAAGGEL